jgi:protein-S-isoprenylcysteine O-methyltransferase Ste14
MHANFYFLIVGGTLLWCAPFVFVRVRRKHSLQLDKRARWGMVLETIAYSLLWQGSFWERSPEPWRVAGSVMLFMLACAFSWSGAFALGRHFRVDAALDAAHELVRSGPYRLVRHPIYTSMLFVLLATGILIARWYLLLPAVGVFLIGTEIRMRVEDGMLESLFGDTFRNYRREVPPLIPFLG